MTGQTPGRDLEPVKPDPYRRAGGRHTKKQKETEALVVLDMKRRGFVDSQIAETVGISIPTVYRRLKFALEIFGEPTAAEYRKVAAEQYDLLLQATMDGVRAKDLDAVKVATAIVEKKSRLLGLEAPQRVEMDITVETPQMRGFQDLLDAARREAEERERDIVEGEVVEDA